MTNTTDIFWSVDGVSLQTFAQNITTLSDRDAPPPMRGEDETIPYATGQKFEPKIADSRIIPLGMWVRGTDADGGLSGSASDQYDDNWRALRNLLWDPDRQFVLKKRFKVGGILRSASALGQFSSGLSPTKIGRSAGRFTIDIKLTDPYFYDDIVDTFTLTGGAQNITVVGDAKTTNIKATFNGGRSNPKVRNNTLGMEVEYHNSLLAGARVEIEMARKRAFTFPSGSPSFLSNGMIRHTGSPDWLKLRAGVNSVTGSSTSGIGAMNLEVRGAWI